MLKCFVVNAVLTRVFVYFKTRTSKVFTTIDDKERKIFDKINTAD